MPQRTSPDRPVLCLLLALLFMTSPQSVPAQESVTVGELSLMITNPAPGRGDFFGAPVVTVGPDKVLIGAYLDDAGEVDAGAAYLFSTNGVLLTTFTNPAPVLRDYFGFRVAAVGEDKVVIGAWEDGADDSGSAYLYGIEGTLLATLTCPVPGNGLRFGQAVGGLGDNQVLVSASSHDGGKTTPGAVFLFSTSGGLLTTFTNPAPDLADAFGRALAAVGTDRVLIGAPQDDAGMFDSGVAYLFSTDGLLLHTFTNPAPGHSDYFGAAVAVVGHDLLVIGAYADDEGATEAGSVYLFHTNGTLLQTISNPNPHTYDRFGSALAPAGPDRFLVSCVGDSRLGGVEGTAYLFHTNGTLVATLVGPPSPSRGVFGASAAYLGGDRFLIGLHQDDTGAEDAGVAFIYGLRTIPVPELKVEAITSYKARLSWPVEALSFRLEWISTLEPGPVFWVEENTLYTTNENRIQFETSTTQKRFYRLKFP